MSVKTIIQSLLNASNEKTGVSDVTLTDAVKTLIDGYGGVASEQPQRDVNFIDYDGRIVYSYTKNDFMTLSSMPANPDHSGDIQWGGHTIALTSQGWNWTLSDAKDYVSQNGKLWIGQLYKTSDNKMHICVRMTDGRLNPAVMFGFQNGAVIDWGDGTEETDAVSEDYNTHEYAYGGDYDISISITDEYDWLILLDGSDLETTKIIAVDDMLDSGAFNSYASSVVMIFLPERIKGDDGVSTIPRDAFYGLNNLKCITIPSSAYIISNAAFGGCRSLESITFPSDVEEIDSFAFSSCCLKTISFPKEILTMGNGAFENTLTDSITLPVRDSIGVASFGGSEVLNEIIIPNGQAVIAGYAFNGCSSLTSVTVPQSVWKIGAGAFVGCASLGYVKFTGSTPPTAEGTFIDDVPEDCIIYVPAGTLSAYQTAENYPDADTFTYVEY